MFFITLSTLLLSSLAAAHPSLRQRRANDDVQLNNEFMSLTTESSCTSGSACIDGQYAQCINGRYVLSPCGSGLTCAALPLAGSPGTRIACTTQADLVRRIVATGATPSDSESPCPEEPTASKLLPSFGSNVTNSSGPQTSLTLLSSVIATNFSQDGLNSSTTQPGEAASSTSVNNFINWCATLPNLPITNGQQLHNGSCNPAPMGAIPSVSNMPSSKFVAPVNLAVIPANTTFPIVVAIKNLATGYFANSDTNYLAAPQQLDPTTGLIQGHAHVVIEALESLNQTTPTDPTKFSFFTVLNSKADANGHLSANVTGGLPEGAYRMSTITTATNHQSLALPVARRGVSNDAIYFTVTSGTNGTTPTPSQVPQPSGSASPPPIISSTAPIPSPSTSSPDDTDCY